MRIKGFWVLAIAATLLSVNPAMEAQVDLTSWTFTPIDISGAMWTRVRGMNGAGQIVGEYRAGSPAVTRGFVLSGGVVTPIQLDAGTGARGINPEGDIVGWVYNSTAGTRGYLLRKGVVTEIKYPGAAFTMPEDINAAGDVVGWYVTGGVEHGFLLRNGTYASIDVPGANLTNARGISPDGEIVGIFRTIDSDGVQRMHGFLLGKDGSFTTINGPGVPNANVNGINPRGDMVGEYSVTGVTGRFGFLLRQGEYTPISYPGGVTITRPWKITPDGQHIVGFYQVLTNPGPPPVFGSEHGFILTRNP